MWETETGNARATTTSIQKKKSLCVVSCPLAVSGCFPNAALFSEKCHHTYAHTTPSKSDRRKIGVFFLALCLLSVLLFSTNADVAEFTRLPTTINT